MSCQPRLGTQRRGHQGLLWGRDTDLGPDGPTAPGGVRRKRPIPSQAMPQPRNLDEVLLRLKELGSALDDPDTEAELREIICSKHSHAIAKAAALAERAQLHELIPDLVTAFGKMLKDPIKSDPGCNAKEAIADALQALNADEGELFLLGAAHVQLEPVYGGRQDTAAGLRGAAARGLVRMNHPDALTVAAELLADPELPARIAGARAIGYYRGEPALPVLRLKVLAGDAESNVIGECLLAMMQISVERSLPFVERLLGGDDSALAEAAALALGESRALEALPPLTQWWKRTVDPNLSRTGLFAIAMLRRDEAIAFLLDLVKNEPGPIARDAIRAFEVYRSDARTIEHLRNTLGARTDLDLLPFFEEELG